jgi:hypothetical protein
MDAKRLGPPESNGELGMGGMSPKGSSVVRLIIAIVLCEAAGAVGPVFTISAIPT